VSIFHQLPGRVSLKKSGEPVLGLAVLYFLTLAFMLLTTHAHFTTGGLVITTLAFLAYLASPLASRQKPASPSVTLEMMFSGLWLVFSVSLLVHNGLLYPQMNLWLVLLKAALAMNCVCATAYSALLFSQRETPRAGKVLLSATLFLVLSCFFFTLKASPAPHIDVFTICSKAADLLRSGRNPYDFLYADIYGGKYTYHPRFMYWPVVTYLVTFSKLVTGDIRTGTIFAHMITAIGLYLLGRQWRWSFQKILLAVIVWFTFPISFFVLEQAWVEVILMPSLVFFIYFAGRRKWVGAAVMAGLACATKQYMPIFGIFSCLYVWRREGWGKTIGYAGIASLTTMLAMLPFFIWDWRVFLDRTVFEILHYDIRTESLSWIAFSINRLRVPFNTALSLALKAVLSVPALVVMFRREEVRPADLMFTQVVVFSAVFLFGNQALCNYYYFLSFLLFLQIVLMAGIREKE
jgi:hypothetical protein